MLQKAIEDNIVDEPKLSELDFWEKTYHESRLSQRYLPNPRWRLGHYELDSVFRKFLPQSPGLRLLELGCGGSVWLPYFCREFKYEVAGVDYSLTGAQQARVNLSRAGCEGVIINSDFLHLESDFTGQFDIIFSFGVIEHFASPGEIINQFSAFLKDGGIIITYIPNLIGIMGHLLKIVNQDFYDAHKLISLEELTKFHSDSKMDILFSSYMQFFDLNILNLSRFGPRLARLGHLAFAALDLPALCVCKILKRTTMPSQDFSSAILVLAKKKGVSHIGRV